MTVAAEVLDKAIIKPFRVTAGETVAKGRPVDFNSGTVQHATAIGDDSIGIALQDGDGDAANPMGAIGAPGHTIKVAILGSNAIVKAKVGTGGCTQGAPARATTDGATNLTVGGGTTKAVCLGQWLATGVVGDLQPLNLAAAGFTVGS
jgi:hypothetical protein